MRVQLILVRRLTLAALALVAMQQTAAAENEFVTKTQVYTDSDHTVVVSPLVRIAKEAWRGGTLGAGFVADIISSASVDVVTNATKHMSDFRKEATLSLGQKLGETTLSGAYIYSTENDYTSHNGSVGVSRDLLQRNTTLALGYAFSMNAVGRSGTPSALWKSLQVHGVDASWTQVLSPRMLLQAAYSFQYDGGYQASPYRFVHLESGDLTTVLMSVPEADPETRYRNAFVVALKRHLFQDSALEVDYRFYFDNWGVMSHTAQAQYLVDFGVLTLRFRERFYYQNAASFFQSHYVTQQPFMTADRELSTFFSNLAGVKAVVKLDRVVAGLSLEAKADFFYFYYIDFAYLASRIGANLGLGLSLRF
jgi:hypothetical protein